MYRDWNGTFYPADITGVKQLPFYAQHFKTVEINSTFYHMPRTSTTQHWYEETPADFCFVLKLNRYLTHTKRLLIDEDSQKSLADFVAAARQLKEKLGIVLVQLPPSLKLDRERLIEFITAANAEAKKQHIDMPLAIEFRHASWFTPEVRAVLHDYNVAQVINDSPNRWPADKHVPATTAYIRFHGNKQLYRSKYTDDELQAWATFMTETCKGCSKVFAFFNNDYDAAAVDNAKTLATFVTKNTK